MAKQKKTTRTILVTGAAGFIGSHTVDALLAAGCEVHGLDNFRTGRIQNLHEASASTKFTLHEFDMNAVGRLDRLMNRVRPQVIIHLAGLVSVQESLSHPKLNQRLNVQSTRNIAVAAVKHQAARIIYASSAAIYGDARKMPIKESVLKNPLSPYGRGKLESEEILLDLHRQERFDAVSLRYFNVYGARQDPKSPYSGVITIFARLCAAGEPLTIFGDGEQTRDYIHVGDVARANVLAALHEHKIGGAFNICTGVPISLNKVATLLRGRQATTSKIIRAPARPGDIRHSCGDPALAKRTFGFESEIRLQQGLRKLPLS